MAAEVESTARSGDRTWWVVALVFAAFWVAYLLFAGPRTPGLLEGPPLDLPAAYDWSLEDLEGNSVRFDRFRGKAVFLNIWATWCGPCVAEMPSIAALAANPRLSGRNLEFVCVSTDDSGARVRKFLEGKNWPMTFLRADALPRVFLTEAIPATFVISPAGRVVAAELGAAEWDNSRVVDYLEKLATAAPAPPPPPG